MPLNAQEVIRRYNQNILRVEWKAPEDWPVYPGWSACDPHKVPPVGARMVNIAYLGIKIHHGTIESGDEGSPRACRERNISPMGCYGEETMRYWAMYVPSQGVKRPYIPSLHYAKPLPLP